MTCSLGDHRKQAFEKAEQTHPMMLNICEPLFRYAPICGAAFMRFFLDEQRQCSNAVILTTSLPVFRWHLLEVTDNGTEFLNASKNSINDEYNYFLWPEKTGDHILQIVKQKFRHFNGISVYKRHDTYIDCWNFSSGENAFLSILNHTNMEILRKWISHFKREASFLINTAPLKYYADKLDMSPTGNGSPSFDFNTLNMSFEMNNCLIKFTKRETECWSFFAQGFRVKEIAKKLNLSPRTVEGYINNIKFKTGYNLRSDLTKMYLDLM
ncbi:MAG: helix-turn-helix transcriptional regulator [Alphaproteobacteria bacterium]|nr:helix-turn-helix transcriptional regulator [Alphaproteobacteria bacterium]